MKHQDQARIIDAIEKASEAELKQLTLIQHTLTENLSRPSGNGGSATGMTVRRSLTRPAPKNDGKTEDVKKDFSKEPKRPENGIISSGSIKRTKKENSDKTESFLKDQKSPKEIKSRSLPDWVLLDGTKFNEKGQSKGRKKANTVITGGAGIKKGFLKDQEKSKEGRKELTESPKEGVKNTPGRDSGGRFKAHTDSAEAAAAQSAKNAQAAANKQQQGFFRSLGGMLENATQTNSDAMASGTDLAGTAAGGPLWMMGKGMYDISAEVGKNVVTLKDWMKGQTEGNTALKIEPPVTHPPVTAEAKQPPALGKPKSADGYKNAQQAKAIQVTQEQTKVIAANDDRIVDALDDVRDEIKKLSHASSSGGGLLDSLMPGRRKRRKRNKSNPLSTAADVADAAADLLPEGHKKTEGARPKPKKKGLMAKALEVLKGGKKAAIAAGATAVTAAGGAALANDTAGAAGEKTRKEGAKAATSEGAKVAGKQGIQVSEAAAETALGKGALKGGLKVAGKTAAKTALKAVPLVGTVLGAGWDAYDGFSDTEGQKKAFGLKDGQAVTARQKSEYTTASVLDMGGLISGASGLLASGASAMGMNGVAKALTFDTGDIAKGLDTGLGKVGDMFSAFTTSAAGAYDKLTGTSAEQTKAITDGTDKTVTAINRLGSQLQGGNWGEDGVGSLGKSAADYADVAQNSIGADLNVGGANAKNRSFRNNNFGNLNFVGQEGASLEAANAKGEARFAKFNTPEEGFRALANQLTSYSQGTSKAAGYKKLNTVQDIIKLYAPQSENDTSQYVDSLSKKLGVRADEQLNLTDPKVMTQMMRGIATIEGGNPQVTNDFMMNAIGHNENGKWVGGKFSDESLKSVNEARAKQGLAPVAADSLYSAGDNVTLKQGAAVPAAPAATAPVAPTGSQAAAAKEAAKPAHGGNGVTDKIKQGAASSWGKVKELNAWADNKVQGTVESMGVAGMSRKRPNSGLSLPAGDALPAGLQLAALSPDQIAKHTRPVPTSRVSSASVSARPASATSSAPITATSQARTNPQAALAASQPDSTGTGFFDRAMSGAMDGMKAVSASIMPAVGDTFSQALGGFSGSDMISSVMDQAGIADPGLLRAVSQITSKAGGWLDSNVESLATAGKSLLSGSTAQARSIPQQPLLNHPAQIQSVTDLPRSGVRPMMNGDNSSHEQDMLKELKGMRSQLEALLGVTKKKGDTAPDKVVNTAQPAPRQSSTLSINDPALNELLQD